MNTDDLKLFVEVARRGSFAAVAADRLVDPSSISRTIAALEAELGLRLFQRTTRSMRLTEAGDFYLSRITHLTDELDAARSEAADLSVEPRGTLRLTASVTFGQRVIVPLLKPFRARYPALKLDCLFTDANVDLITNRIDLAIRLAPNIEGDLIAAKLMDTRYRVVATRRYLDNAPPIHHPTDIAAHACVLFQLKPFNTEWQFRDANGAITRVPVHGDITLSPASTLLSAVLDDLGPALLPDWLVDEEIAKGRLVAVLPLYKVTATTFDTAAFAVYPSRAYLPNKVRVMIDFLKEHLNS